MSPSGVMIVDDYCLPFAFNGGGDKVTFDLGLAQSMTRADRILTACPGCSRGLGGGCGLSLGMSATWIRRIICIAAVASSVDFCNWYAFP
jgi:hypothetical protein